MTALIWLAASQQGIIILAGGASLWRFGWPWRHPDRNVAWLVWLWAGAGVADALAWLAAIFSWPVPPIAYLIAFALLDVAAVWRTVLIKKQPHAEQ